jgi:hypothetical protein
VWEEPDSRFFYEVETRVIKNGNCEPPGGSRKRVLKPIGSGALPGLNELPFVEGPMNFVYKGPEDATAPHLLHIL